MKRYAGGGVVGQKLVASGCSVLVLQLYITVGASLLPRLWEKQPGNFCEFKLYTDVTSQQLQYLIQPVNTRLARVILTIFPAARMGLSCSWKQLFAVGSTTEVT